MPKKQHVFISYCHDNAAEVSRLRDDMLAAGEAVWWDGDIVCGGNWRLEIQKALAKCYAVVICLSKEATRRHKSGIYPEARDAIEAYREYPPGSVFLIPVRLSACDIPPIAIDATLALDGLQYVDLFPPSKRGDGLARLLAAIRAAPEHS